MNSATPLPAVCTGGTSSIPLSCTLTDTGSAWLATVQPTVASQATIARLVSDGTAISIRGLPYFAGAFVYHIMVPAAWHADCGRYTKNGQRRDVVYWARTGPVGPVKGETGAF